MSVLQAYTEIFAKRFVFALLSSSRVHSKLLSASKAKCYFATML